MEKFFTQDDREKMLKVEMHLFRMAYIELQKERDWNTAHGLRTRRNMILNSFTGEDWKNDFCRQSIIQSLWNIREAYGKS